MKKFLKIYFLLAFLSSALLWIGVNNGGYFSYKVREQLNTKHVYDVKIQKVLLANKDANNTLHVCLDIAKEPNHKQGIYYLSVPLNTYKGRISYRSPWYYNDKVNDKDRYQGYIEKLIQGFTVTFPESALKEGCDVNSSIPIRNNPHFNPPTGVNDYPLILELDSNLTSVVYYPLDIKKGYFYHKNFFVYAENQPFVDSDWNDDGGSNYLIVELRGDRYYHDKYASYLLPLAIVADFLTSPLQVVMGLGLWILMIASGVKC
jgi:hypothetical protein